MKKLFVFLLAGVTPAMALDLINNGSFENGTNGWLLGTSPHQIASIASHGTSGLRFFSRASFTNAPQQIITTALAGAPATSWTARFDIQVAAPTVVRCWAQIASDTNGLRQTNRVLLAEAVVRQTNQWFSLEGTAPLSWNGTLVHALVYFEAGLRQETVRYPDCIIDHVRIRPDADADQLWDEEESLSGSGTDPNNPDSDADGLPDGWEWRMGTDALVSDQAEDPDEDTFTNWHEYQGATQPTNALSYPGRPAHSQLSEEAKALLTFLATLPARAANRVLAGQHLSDTAAEWTNHIARLHEVTGRWPGLVSFTAESGSGFQMTNVVPRAQEVWTNGGVVLVKWAMANPWNNLQAGATNPSGVNIPELLNPNAQLATNQIARSNYLAGIDHVAQQLALLREAKIPVLFRPCSEMNGAWFWWGNKPRDQYLSLWNDLHDRLTLQYGLTNLLWVYEPDASAHLVVSAVSSGTPIDYYYPGDDRVDVVGHNFYDDDWILPFDSDTVMRRYEKIFAVPQAGPKNRRDGSFDNLTYLQGVTNTIPRCAFFCVWNSFITGGGKVTNSVAIADNGGSAELLHHPLVMTREEVDWFAFLAPAVRLEFSGPALHVHWQGAGLQHSGDLAHWTDVAAPARPYASFAPAGTLLFWRALASH